jgi:hypothetical protein
MVYGIAQVGCRDLFTEDRREYYAIVKINAVLKVT